MLLLLLVLVLSRTEAQQPLAETDPNRFTQHTPSVSFEELHRQCHLTFERAERVRQLRVNRTAAAFLRSHNEPSSEERATDDPFFTPHPVHIFYRFSPRAHKGGDQGHISTSCIVSLFNAIKHLSPTQKQWTALHVLIGGFCPSLASAWAQWIQSNFQSHLGSLHVDTNCPRGNDASYRYMMSQIGGIQDGLAIAFLIEDDYALQDSAIAETIAEMRAFGFCIAVPYDYPDRYTRGDNNDDGHVAIVMGQHRHWRTVESTTVTLALRVDVLRTLGHNRVPAPWSDREPSRAYNQQGIDI